MPVDCIMGDGVAYGSVAQKLLQYNMDYHALRPYIGDDGRSYINRMARNGEMEAVLMTNAVATLPYDVWKYIDNEIIEVAKLRLKAVADLRGANLVFNMPGGMSHTALQYQLTSDITPATISMDPIRKSEGDRPEVTTAILPLPVIHKDFNFTLREILASRNGNVPLDTFMARAAGEVVAEEAEKLLIGTASSYKYAGGTVYGYTNFPSRLTKTLTVPTTANHDVTVAEILDMRQKSVDAKHYGPWFLYFSQSWGTLLATDYSTTKGEGTLQDRILKIPGIKKIELLDYLPTKTCLLVEASTKTVREVISMDITTVQWEENGGFQLNWKVLAMMTPQLRADQNGNTGIVHGTHA